MYMLIFSSSSPLLRITIDTYILLLKGHIDDHLHVHMYIVPTMLAELLYPLQGGYTPLHIAALRGHTACVEHLLSTPGIDVDTSFQKIITVLSLRTNARAIRNRGFRDD